MAKPRITPVRLDAALIRIDRNRWLIYIGSLLVLGTSWPVAAQVSRSVADEVSPAHVEAPHADIDVGAIHTDNVRRVDANAENDTILSVGMAVDTKRDGPRLDYTVTGDVNYQEYADNTYKGQVFGFLDGIADIALVPERFDWTFRETFNQLLVDPAVAATPDNLSTFSYFTTGPRLMVRFGSANELALQGTYSTINAHDAPDGTFDLDSKRYGGSLVLTRRVSEAGRASINITTQHIKFDEEQLNADYDRDEATLSYDVRLSRTSLAAEIGSSRIKAEQGDNSSGLVARLAATRKLSPSSTLSLSFERQTADAADILRYGFGIQNPSETPLRVASRDPLVDNTLNLGWSFSRSRTGLDVNVYRTTERYTVSTNLDRTMEGASVTFERRLQPSLGLDLLARYENEKFENTSLKDHLLETTAALTWYAGRRLKVALQGSRFDRTGEGTTLTYTENRIGVVLGYSLLQARR